MYIYNGLIQAWDVKNKTIIGLKLPTNQNKKTPYC